MKKIFFVVMLIFFFKPETNYAQQSLPDEGKKIKTKIYSHVDVMPEFPGGFDSLANYLQSTIYFKSAWRDYLYGGINTLITIDTSGKVIKAVIQTVCPSELERELKESLYQMPNWKPGRLDGMAVKVEMGLPIALNMNDGSHYTSKLTIARNEWAERAKEYFERGVEMLKNNKFEQAIKYFNKAIRGNSKYIDAYFNRGVAFLKLNQISDACYDWKKAKELGDKEAGELIIKYCGNR